MSAERCVGVLMAGGAARRFDGAPKGLARVDGQRIADRMLAALRGATDAQIVVANDARATRWFPDTRVARDEIPGLGPLGGIRTALRAADDANILVVAWDMPFVTTELLSAMRAIGERGADAVAPEHGGPPRIEPLCAYYGSAALATCERLLAGGERRASALCDALPRAVRLSGAALAAFGEPGRLLCSVDSPEVLAMLGGSPPEDDAPARR